MDTSSKRKFSLDSKSSSDQYDLIFTRSKFKEYYKWCCCGIATFLLMLLLTATAIYFAYCAMEEDRARYIAFRANFKVIEGDAFNETLIDTNSTSYLKKSTKYKELINLLIRQSRHNKGFERSEILALDGIDGNGMAVHFKLIYDERKCNVTSDILREHFYKLFNKTERVRSYRFNELTIDPESLYIGDPRISEEEATTLEVIGLASESKDIEIITEPPRICVHSKLNYCNHDNTTSYPNLFKHMSQKQVLDDLVRFREIVDSECYPDGAYLFVCQLLQPTCAFEDGQYNTSLILPCQSQCLEFMAQCAARLPIDINTIINCENFNVDC